MSEIKKSNSIDPRNADAGYKPFPSFSEWTKKCEVEEVRWNRYSAKLAKAKESPKADITRVREAIELATAIDTGAIEGLYDTDRGFTYTVAFVSAVWQSVVEEKKGKKVRALIESQLSAFEYVLDFATKNVPITSAWIRELHREICKEQETYTAITEIGLQNLPLPKGKYKTLPNHVLKQDETIHSYAPVDFTASEMMRLCDELNSDEFQKTHPVLQSAYAHYSFVCIHPFADGNGRVSRALASVYTYRSHSIPLLIFAENRNEYIASLEEADKGSFQVFVAFILSIGLSSIQLFTESLETNGEAEIENSVEKINELFVTKGGYSHEQVDEAGYNLANSFQEELRLQLENIHLPEKVKYVVGSNSNHKKPISKEYRLPISEGKGQIVLRISTQPPASATISRNYSLEVPKDCGKNDDIILRELKTNYTFEARASELIPTPTAALQMRINLTTTKIIKTALKELYAQASKTLSQ